MEPTLVSHVTTGTLTQGKPKVTSIATVNGFDETYALQLIASAEAKSSHPLANAMMEEIKKRNLAFLDKVEKFQNLSGLGVKAIVEGKQVLVVQES